MRAFDAVFFDFDGVLVDSVSAHRAAYATVFRELGLEEIARSVILLNSFAGSRTIDVFRTVGRKFNRPDVYANAAQHSKRKSELVGPVFWMPHAISLLRKLRALVIPVALCSSGSGPRIKKIIAGDDEKLFACVLTAEDVRRPKPFADVYEKGFEYIAARWKAHDMPLQRERCLVVEDSVEGVKAGVSAGMQVCGLLGTFEQLHLSAAHYHVSSLEAVELIVLGLGEHFRSKK